MNAIMDLFADKKLTRLESIKHHLSLLLNTRQGSLAHMPDYGLPDVTTLYQQLPDTKFRFIVELTKAIERYEPRLHSVNVTEANQRMEECVLHFKIDAIVDENQHAFFDTYFLSNGQVKI